MKYQSLQLYKVPLIELSTGALSIVFCVECILWLGQVCFRSSPGFQVPVQILRQDNDEGLLPFLEAIYLADSCIASTDTSGMYASKAERVASFPL